MPARISAEKIQEILKSYKSGNSMETTAKLCGVSFATVHVYMKENGLVGTRPRAWGQDKQILAIDLYSQGLSAAECARRIGCKQETIAKYLRLNGITPRTHAESMQGAGNPAWNGGRTIDKSGYVCLWAPNHPNANSGGYVREHRMVMGNHLGRNLLETEVVHHKDKNKQNNHIDNLELFASNGEHLAHELAGQIPKWTEDGIRRIDAGRRSRGQKKTHPKTYVSQSQLFDDQTEE